MLRPDKKKERQESATKRNEAWQNKTPEEQLRDLDLRLGHGFGAKKQRARIAQKLEK